MLKIKKDEYEISQASNNHVMICKDGKMLFHASMTKELTKEELLKQLNFYLKLVEKIGSDKE